MKRTSRGNANFFKSNYQGLKRAFGIKRAFIAISRHVDKNKIDFLVYIIQDFRARHDKEVQHER